MTNKQKVFFIIQQRRIVTYQDLINITNWQKITVLRAIAALMATKRIRILKRDNDRYFAINDKPLKNG